MADADDQGRTFVCDLPVYAGSRPAKPRLDKLDARELSDAITLLESGRVDQAATVLRLFLHRAGYPVPARPNFRGG